MAVTVAFENYTENEFAHPEVPNVPPLSLGLPGTASHILKQVNADDYSGRYDVLAAHGIRVLENNVARPGSEVRSTTGSFADTSHICLCDTGGGDITVTIPDASTVGEGFRLWLYFRTDGGGNVIVEGAGADTIIGVANKVLTTAGQKLELISDGVTNWEDATTSHIETAGFLLSAAPTFDLEPAQILTLAIDAAAGQNFTFNATAAVRTSVEVTPFTLTNGNDLIVEVNGVEQTVTFATADYADIANATDAELVIVLNRDLTGVTVTAAGGAIVVTTDRRGTGASLEFTGGTDAAAFGFPGALIAGTGDALNIDAVTSAEVITKLAGLTGATATLSSGRVKITSSTLGVLSVVAGSGTASAGLGLNATGTGTES